MTEAACLVQLWKEKQSEGSVYTKDVYYVVTDLLW